MQKTRKHTKRIIFTLLLVLLLAMSVPAVFAYFNWEPMWVNGPSGTMGSDDKTVEWALYYDYAEIIIDEWPKPVKLVASGNGTLEKIEEGIGIFDVIELDVAAIGEGAFDNIMFYLADPMFISKRLAYVGENAFPESSSNYMSFSVNYEGTEEEWRQIDIREGNEALLEAYDSVDSNHSWNTGVITTPATCQAEGERTYTCSVCGKTKTESIDKTAHDFVLMGQKEATCFLEGYTGDYFCRGCGAQGSIGSVIAKKAHTWDAGVITTPATCSAEGIKTFTCSVCGETMTETIEKTTKHSYAVVYFEENGKWYSKSVCSTCGNEMPANEHFHRWDQSLGSVTFEGLETLSFFQEKEYTRTCVCGYSETIAYQLQVDDELTKSDEHTGIIRYADKGESLGIHPHYGYSWASIGFRMIDSGAQYEQMQAQDFSFKLFQIRAVCENNGSNNEVLGGTIIKELFKIPVPEGYNEESLKVYKIENNKLILLESFVEDSYVVVETAYPDGYFYLAVTDEHVSASVEDASTGIAVSFDGKTYTDEITLSVTPVDNTENYLVKNYDKIAAWTIKTLVNGTIAQPNGDVTVSIPLPAGFDQNSIAVYHVDDEGKIERITSVSVIDGKIIFVATEFNVYIVVDESSEVIPHTHSYTSIVTTPPTCASDGVRTYTCVNGDDSYIEPILALGHAELNENGDCPRCGKHIKDVEKPADPAADNSNDNVQDQPSGKVCKYCGEVHEGFFGKIIGFFHSILALFGLKK